MLMRREELSRTMHLHVLPYGMPRETVERFRSLPAGGLTNQSDFLLWGLMGGGSNCWLGDGGFAYLRRFPNSHCAEGYVPPPLRRIFGVMGERIQKLDRDLQMQI